MKDLRIIQNFILNIDSDEEIHKRANGIMKVPFRNMDSKKIWKETESKILVLAREYGYCFAKEDFDEYLNLIENEKLLDLKLLYSDVMNGRCSAIFIDCCLILRKLDNGY